MDRNHLLDRLTDLILEQRRSHPLRVCIDGPDGAGKTVMADEVGERIVKEGRSLIRASIDGFHRPSVERFARYGDSPEGYYRDSFDYPALRQSLLQPLGPDGNLTYRVAAFDFRSDQVPEEEWGRADPEAVLVFDGVFLLRPELRDLWDIRIYLRVDWDEVLRRVIERDSSWMGSRDEVRNRYLSRYIPGQELYRREASPEQVADILIDNSRFQKPEIVRGLN